MEKQRSEGEEESELDHLRVGIELNHGMDVDWVVMDCLKWIVALRWGLLYDTLMIGRDNVVNWRPPIYTSQP